MRKGVDYIGVGIGAVMVNSRGEMFLSKRGINSQNEAGKWEFPGGALEYGEGFEVCIKREMREEFGVEVEVIEQLEPFNHLIPEEHQHWVALCFVGKVISGEPRILEPEKSQEIGWFTLSHLETMDLTLTAEKRLKQIKVKFPKGISFLF